jgi:hypothetical protein
MTVILKKKAVANVLVVIRVTKTFDTASVYLSIYERALKKPAPFVQKGRWF